MVLEYEPNKNKQTQYEGKSLVWTEEELGPRSWGSRYVFLHSRFELEIVLTLMDCLPSCQRF
jgi:hypothetical protein